MRWFQACYSQVYVLVSDFFKNRIRQMWWDTIHLMIAIVIGIFMQLFYWNTLTKMSLCKSNRTLLGNLSVFHVNIRFLSTSEDLRAPSSSSLEIRQQNNVNSDKETNHSHVTMDSFTVHMYSAKMCLTYW